MKSMADIEKWLSKPCWIIDILPKQVPVGAAGQYFAIEKHFLSPPHIDAIYRKFAILLLKLNCYDDIAVYQVSNESWQENPAPSVLEQLVLERKPLLVVLKQSQAMLSITGDDHYMAVYGDDENTLQLIGSIACAEGLHIWKP